MSTTQPPLIVAIDGEAKVNVSNTGTNPVNVKLTNPMIEGPPSVLCMPGKKLRLTLMTASASDITVKQRHGAWLEVTVNGLPGWINTNTITADNFVFWT
jgi:hypothetical protein